MSITSSIRNTIVKYGPKALGIGALGVVGYDAHVIGKIHADTYSKTKDANAMARAYNNTRVLAGPSQTTAILKDEAYKLEMDNNFRHFINSAIGYFKGFGLMLIDGVVPFTLGLTALLGKGFTAKAGAVGIGVYGIVKLFKDVLGFGHSNDLNKKF